MNNMISLDLAGGSLGDFNAALSLQRRVKVVVERDGQNRAARIAEDAAKARESASSLLRRFSRLERAAEAEQDEEKRAQLAAEMADTKGQMETLGKRAGPAPAAGVLTPQAANQDLLARLGGAGLLGTPTRGNA